MADTRNIESQLLQAAQDGGAEQVHQILRHHGDLVNVRDSEGRTALHWAAAGNFYRMAQILLAHAADMQAEDRSGKIPLQLAEEHGYREVAQLLRDAEWPNLD